MEAKRQELIDLQQALQLQYDVAADDFGLFVQAAWEILEPQTELQWNWHHDYICEHLQAVDQGQILRLIINIAPRSTKSILSTVSFPVWTWIKKPHKRFLFGSYADTLATKHSILRRNIIESPWYQAGYSQSFRLSSDVNTKSEFTNNKTGQMTALGIRGAVTGMGADCIVIDDPHNPKGAESEAELESTIQNFDLAWSTRLNDKKTGAIIIIMQRLRENDLTGHLLEKNMGYLHLKIPTVAEERERLVFPLSGKVFDREAGDLMHPSRDGPKEIEIAKKAMGPYGFSGQHQQSPTPASGGIFKSDMFDFVDLPKEVDWRFVTADTAYKDAQENDFTVFVAWGVKGEDLYIIDVFRKQIKAVDIESDVTPFLRRFSHYGFRGVYVEPKGHGIFLNQAFPRKGILVPGEDDLKEFYSDRRWDKVQRASNAVPHLANRKIHINNVISEKEILLNEVLKFPKAPHDDFTDCVVDGIKVVYAKGLSIFDVL